MTSVEPLVRNPPPASVNEGEADSQPQENKDARWLNLVKSAILPNM